MNKISNNNTKLIGNIAELEVLTYVTKLGYQVSIPFGDRARYDQIWEVGGKLFKIQVKNAHEVDGGNAIEISCRSSNRSGGKSVNRKYTPDEVDFIASYYKDKCYLIPISEITGKAKRLRFTNAKNNQLVNINLASDYEVEKIMQVWSIRSMVG